MSGDANKIITQTDPSIDAHLFHATIYFKAEFEQILGTGLSHRDITIKAKEAMDAGNKRVKELRQLSKAVTFGASLTYKRLHTVMYVEQLYICWKPLRKDEGNQQVSLITFLNDYPVAGSRAKWFETYSTPKG